MKPSTRRPSVIKTVRRIPRVRLDAAPANRRVAGATPLQLADACIDTLVNDVATQGLDHEVFRALLERRDVPIDALYAALGAEGTTGDGCEDVLTLVAEGDRPDARAMLERGLQWYRTEARVAFVLGLALGRQLGRCVG